MKKRLRFRNSVIAVGVFLVLFGLVSPSILANSWFTFHNNYQRIGVTGGLAPDTAHVIWSVTLPGGGFGSSPAVVSGKVYIGSWDNNVYCFDAYKGEQLWSFPTGDHIWTPPTVINGKVFIGSKDQVLYCLDAETGELIWSFPLLGRAPKESISNPIVLGGRVYFGAEDGKVYCLDESDGDTIWTTTVGTGTYGVCGFSYANGRIFAGSDDNAMHCLDASNGDSIWSFLTDDMIFSSPAIKEGKVYFGSHDGNVYCVSEDSGALKWQFPTGDVIWSSPAVWGDKVYIGSDDKHVYCLDATDGHEIWATPTSWDVRGSPAIADGKVYVGVSDNYPPDPGPPPDDVFLYCLDAETGAVIWQYNTPAWIFSSPAIAYTNVYVGSHDNYSSGTLYCFGKPPPFPTITQWGLIILVILVVGSGIWLMIKRRRLKTI
jgi:outer membrane protein assembly factor BamB